MKDKLRLSNFAALVFLNLILGSVQIYSQPVLFDFDNAPLYTSFPIDQTAGGITAHFTATGQGYSIQNANALGFTPTGFSGRILYPNSIYLSDITIQFDQLISDFSILYCCQELGCDDAATMKVTAYKNGALIGFNTRTATYPGTYPVDTLKCSFAQGFNSVVLHYQQRPPTCQDYGVIYLADKMQVTSLVVNVNSANSNITNFGLVQNYPNPFNPSTTIKYFIPTKNFVTLKIYDSKGTEVMTIVNEYKDTGEYEIQLNNTNLSSGVYYYKLIAGDFSETKKMIILK
ncbi:MAG: T9SS type A sorting domain-containing protein [Bacteroidetes bacterium]|nr:T9SS type A sorting domain-containing protein [Bacteroidota bacterium]